MKFRYSFSKSRRILRKNFALFQRKKGRLSDEKQQNFEQALRTLDEALLAKDKSASDKAARHLHKLGHEYFPKTIGKKTSDLILAILFALTIAFVVRTLWFELYEVPTGSMRPTIEELDRMVVSKTTFGLHIPFKKDLLFFNTDRIKRDGIIVFTTKGMDVADSNMLYFYIFPGKKRFIKRAVGKDGDTITFYGGRVHGVDKQGEHFVLSSSKKLERIDHVPYIYMGGKAVTSKPVAGGIYSDVLLKQMNIPVGRLRIAEGGVIEGTFFDGKKWQKDRPSELKKPHDSPMSYADLWGFDNYAMTRLLTREQVSAFYHLTLPPTEGLYLEMRHTPNLTYPKPEIRLDGKGQMRPMITPYVALLALDQKELSTLQENLYTARFVVRNGYARAYAKGRRSSRYPQFDVPLKNVPEGTYEFYYGIGYKVYPGGVMRKLPKDHPLYDKEYIQTLFNLGVSFNKAYAPTRANQPYHPQRFAFYRDGDLFVMGGKLLSKADPKLQNFVNEELAKQKESTSEAPYIAYIDRGAPTPGKIKNFGLFVPEDGVVALGDNYAMSGDSREFGFAPTTNLRGAPSFTFWPPSNRVGPLNQPAYPWFTLPNFLVWILAALIIVGCILFARRRNRRSIFKDEE